MERIDRNCGPWAHRRDDGPLGLVADNTGTRLRLVRAAVRYWASYRRKSTPRSWPLTPPSTLLSKPGGRVSADRERYGLRPTAQN